MAILSRGTPEYATLEGLVRTVGARNVLYALAVIHRDHASHARSDAHAAQMTETSAALEAAARTLPVRIL